MLRTAHFKLGLFIYCLFALVSITLLLFAGGFTTSIKAGMAFLDWPLSNGSINPEGWLSEKDKFAEHSHRLLGMQIGIIAIGLVLWTFLREERAWVRKLAWALLGLVIFQGLLGGARVLFDQLNTQAESNLLAQFFLVAHASGRRAPALAPRAPRSGTPSTRRPRHVDMEQRQSARAPFQRL